MADVETDALGGAALGEIEEVLVFHDARPGLAVEAVGDDVAGAEDLEHFVIKRHGSPTCTIIGTFKILAIFLPSLTGVTPQDPVMTWLARTLMPTMCSLFSA